MKETGKRLEPTPPFPSFISQRPFERKNHIFYFSCSDPNNISFTGSALTAFPMGQATPFPHRPSAAGCRNSVAGFFVIFLLTYSLYCSKLLLTKDDNSNCHSLRSPAISKREELEKQVAPFTNSSEQNAVSVATQVKHIAFGIAASADLWDTRKEYMKLWWRTGETRGVVWLDRNVTIAEEETQSLPEFRISEDTSGLPYTHRQGKRSALRISRVVSETLRLGMKDVRWFVMGDDDTVFVVDNLIRVLSKYDHNQLYYIGGSSESHIQNIFFSYAMAYGGGGFAISYPLALELEKMQDSCIQRYPGLYGSDDRIQACMAELGVPLSKELGFHQYDVYGSLLGLLGAHPVTPLVSLHHLDVVDPVFPGMTRVEALQKLFESAKHDSASIVQQSICYDKKRNWSISVSWGYVIQIIKGIMSPRELEMPTRTFLNWYKRADYTAYAFNTRPVTRHPCQKPYLYYLSSVRYDDKRRQTLGVYSLHEDSHPYCRWKTAQPDTVKSIVVLKRPDRSRWKKSPRRDCCRVLPSKKRSVLFLWVGNCGTGELSVS